MSTARLTSAPIVPSLAKLGWPATADLVFRALSLSGGRTVDALARDLGIPPAQIASTLEELREAGLAVRSPARATTRWRAAPPAAVHALTENERRRPDPGTVARRFAAVTGAAGDVTRLGPGITHLTSRQSARQRMASLVAVARQEHLALNPEPTFDESAMRAAGAMDRSLLERGVSMRIVGVQPENPGLLLPYGGRPVNPTGIAYREAGQVPLKLVVVDRRVALFPVDPNNYELGYLEVAQAPVVESLVETFHRQWDAAGDPVRGGPAFTARETALLALLVRGHTDAAAARALGISERSVSSTVRVLMDRFGVRSRFQLGIVLGASGAVAPPPGVKSTEERQRCA